MILLRSDLDAEKRDVELAKFEAFLKKEGAVNIDALVRANSQALAYPIKGWNLYTINSPLLPFSIGRRWAQIILHDIRNIHKESDNVQVKNCSKGGEKTSYEKQCSIHCQKVGWRPKQNTITEALRKFFWFKEENALTRVLV